MNLMVVFYNRTIVFFSNAQSLAVDPPPFSRPFLAIKHIVDYQRVSSCLSQQIVQVKNNMQTCQRLLKIVDSSRSVGPAWSYFCLEILSEKIDRRSRLVDQEDKGRQKGKYFEESR